MALFNRDYDRDYRYRNDAGGYRAGSTWGNDRDYNAGGNRGYNTMGAYDRDYRYRGTPGGRVDGGLAYDRDYNASRMGGGYDRDYGYRGKSRFQTEQGDPFNDRSRHTPIRVMRGEYEGNDRYDRDYRGNQSMNRGYDREYENRGYSAGVGYDPYDNPNNNANRGGIYSGRQNMNRGYGRGYDNGMF